MVRSALRLFLTIFIMAVLSAAQNDPASGIRLFSTNQFGIDLATSNVYYQIAGRSKAGKLPFLSTFNGNSHVYLATSSKWGAFSGFGIDVAPLVRLSGTTTGTCPNRFEENFIIMDGTGAQHPVGHSAINICPTHYTSGTWTTTDGSGYTLVVTSGNAVVYDANGVKNTISGPLTGFNASYTATDPDGASVTFNTSTDEWVDSFGVAALTVGSQGNNATYSYTDGNGNTSQFVDTFSSTNLNQLTNFQCAGIAEASGSLIQFGQVTPYGGTYSFTYESTPGKSGYYTGRLAKTTFPTGASISYGYSDSAGHNGINCTSAVVPKMTVTLNDNNGNVGTWTYINNNNTASAACQPGGQCNFTVVETDPVGNQMLYNFAGEFQTEAAYYSGGCPTSTNGCSGGGTLLRTVTTCYNGNVNNGLAGCQNPSYVPAMPIKQTDVYTWVGVTPQSLTETIYDCKAANPCYGLATEVKKYDYGAPIPPSGTPLSDTTIVYNTGSTCGTLDQYISNRPCSITVSAPSGQISQTKYTYNSGGQPTQTQRWVSGSTFITSSATYGTNGAAAGILSSFTDVNNATTTFSNFACNGMLPQTKTLPQIPGESFQMSSSQTWDCNGGVQTGNSDVNGNPTSFYYKDSMWRPTEVDYPDQGKTITSYNDMASPPNVQVQRLQDANSDWVTTKTNFDGLGRIIQQQIVSDPSGTNYVDTTYDLLGRVASVSNNYRTRTDYTYGVTYYTYDPLGRVTKVTNPDNSKINVTPTGRAVQITNERNVSEIRQYDALGRLVTVCTGINAAKQANGAMVSACGQDIAANGFLAAYSYNLTPGSGSSLGVNYSGQSRQYLYDGLSRLMSETNPEFGLTSGTTTYIYDQSGQQGDLYQRVGLAPNQPKNGTATVTTTYTYDPLHRLTGISYSGGYTTPSVNLLYDVTDPTWNVSGLTNLKGNLVSAWEGNSVSSLFDYDSMGRTVDVWQCTPHSSCNSSGSVHSYAQYDYLAEPTFVRVGTNDPVSYTYDTTPHLLHVNDPDNANFHYLYNILYNGLELPRNKNIGDGNQITLQYDQRGGLTSLSALNGSTTTYSLAGC